MKEEEQVAAERAARKAQADGCPTNCSVDMSNSLLENPAVKITKKEATCVLSENRSEVFLILLGRSHSAYLYCWDIAQSPSS
jgi:hypothetical protein